MKNKSKPALSFKYTEHLLENEHISVLRESSPKLEHHI